MSAIVLGDWGTSQLRLWRLEGGAVRDTAQGPGIGQLQQTPADALSQVLAPWLLHAAPAQIVLCGMAGARNGLFEVPYCPCPTDAAEWAAGGGATHFQGISLRIAAGVSCRNASHVPDVMRGEETQIFGAIALQPELGAGQHWLVLPGTHSKWAMLTDGRITRFRTFLTGELYALLMGSSLIATGAPVMPADEEAGFSDGIARARGSGGLLGTMFEARSGQLCDGRSASWARGFLSGLVIGAELGEMLRTDDPHPITLIGEPRLTQRYQHVLAALGGAAEQADGTPCAIAGLRMIHADD